MNKKTIVLATLTLVIGLGAGLVLGRPDVRADDRGQAAQDLIAVTGTTGSGASVLWLIDAKERRVSVYKSELGKNIVWVAARDISYDFKVEGFHDESSFTKPKLREHWLKSGQKDLEGTESRGSTGSGDSGGKRDSGGRPDDSGRDRGKEDGDK
jgi:hypothetical protein